MDAKYLAGDFGRLLAAGTVAHTLSLESGVTGGPVCPFPVHLEPPFSNLDPLQTFGTLPAQRIIQAPVIEEWTVLRVILPVMGEVNSRQAEAFSAGLAGFRDRLAFEFFAT